ncbi:protein EARLY RESPONSIVE TO DEHYDRATION 15-like [Juglans microcarpa x Juglans regia]|uniref:protein EARLY RESPONSIVE TO DEHYDRATION 15-like n=1 Tax=Juglans microcarpa x Juglans regia TaxID=2249226 RepID=UPI001B7E4620|nr:protein EARLY RESPONSIVE TO DEHYDRATION 15-like [Juglans microcarpa x Juglans regia]XP_041028648.1 protein EARLY RESPONSIVE TO DEHYDRATION 15-like [Juglans microcarpa x Juglans regia]XP_041028649.1 protein EARLY RESPONSIVE TO DEHYDRATION 15-like [Juglans microcarpa x Juglans regia]
MAMVSGGRSTLNPNAPLFIPAAFRQVEDFSPEWWQLVTTSSWYHDYWLSQRQGEDSFCDNAEDDFDGIDVADLLPETFEFDDGGDFSNMEAQFEEYFVQSSEHRGLEMNAETLVKNLKTLDERGPKSPVQPAKKYNEKPAKYVNPKCSPRRIQQPR